MNIARWFVIWIGSQEMIAGLLFLWLKDYPNAVAWLAYGVACVGLALAGIR